MHDDDDLALALAESAGRLLLSVRESGVFAGKDLGAAGDALAHEFLARALRVHRPADGFLSEEEAADPARLEHSRIWIVDPLDGTREYSEGRPDWAVHVALVVHGFPTSSAVALPGLGTVLSTAVESTVPARGTGPVRIAVSRSRPPRVAGAIARMLAAELVPMGSAGFKAMAVVRGEVDAYVHAGGQYEWDSAAPAGVAMKAGLRVCRLDGSALVFGKPDPWSPELVVCRPDLADELLAGIAASGTEET